MTPCCASSWFPGGRPDDARREHGPLPASERAAHLYALLRPGLDRLTAVDSRDTPYLSVVVTTRNDDHGGDPLKRLQAFVNTFDAQCRRTGLDAEVIVVEWNPPSDRSRLYDLIRLPALCAFAIRFVEVPSELHARLPHA